MALRDWYTLIYTRGKRTPDLTYIMRSVPTIYENQKVNLFIVCSPYTLCAMRFTTRTYVRCHMQSTINSCNVYMSESEQSTCNCLFILLNGL